MGWNSTYLEWIEGRTFEPIFVLEFVDGTSYGAAGVGQTYKIASHPGVYGADEVKISVGGIQTGSCSGTPGTWNYTAGAWSVTVAGSVATLLNFVTRGSLARLKVYSSLAHASSPMPGGGMTIALGVLQNIVGRPPGYTLQFWDIIAAMAGRRDTDTHDVSDNEQCALFWRTGLPSDYLAQNYSAGDAQMVLASGDDFEVVTGGSAVAKVEPLSGEPYYVSYTGVTSVPSINGLTDNVHGTTTVSATGGPAGTARAAVYPCAWLYGTPGDIVMRILTSTGTGSNGAHDIYPAAWGFGIPYTWIDESDIDEWSAGIIEIATTTGVASETIWSTIIDAPIENPASWLSSYLSAAGVWLVSRQGEVSIRCCQDPHGSDLVDAAGNATEVSQGPITSGITITNDDIVQVSDHQLFDSQTPYESGRHKVSWYDTSATPDDNPKTTWNLADALTLLGTFPGVASVTTDLSDRLYGTTDNKADGADYRMKSWAVRVPERIKLRCGGLRLSQLVPGDLVNLTTDRITGRPDPRDQHYTRRVCMVTSISVNWLNPAVDLTLSYLPEGGAL